MNACSDGEMPQPPALPTTSTLSPADPEIRLALLALLRGAHRDDEDTAFIEELGLCRGRVRVDVAVVNGILHGYEIKSDRDSLRRLAGQVALYSQVLDRATLVAGPAHAEAAVALIPAWWEVIVVDGSTSEPRLELVRSGATNPHRTVRALVELLWLEDSLALLDARGGARGYRTRPRREVWDRVCELYTEEEIADSVRGRLKARSAPRGTPLPA